MAIRKFYTTVVTSLYLAIDGGLEPDPLTPAPSQRAPILHHTAAKETVVDFNTREEVFGFPPTEYPVLDTIEKELDPFFKLWNMIADFSTQVLK